VNKYCLDNVDYSEPDIRKEGTQRIVERVGICRTSGTPVTYICVSTIAPTELHIVPDDRWMKRDARHG
jgi:hypothetical protein